MLKIDLKKELNDLYQPSAKKIVQVEVPEFRFLMVDGEGDPNTTSRYSQVVESLFAVSYAAKFMMKKAPGGVDYAVMPLEGLWWADDMASFGNGDRSRWKWTMMVLQPDFVPPELLHEAIAETRRKKSLPAIDDLRIESFAEGLCAQTLHIGPFSEEGPVIERIHSHIQAGSSLRGKHHEIYLSDIRRTVSSKWRTILRQPMTDRQDRVPSQEIQG